MTEEIIIDGVNIAGCGGLNKNSLPLKQCDLLQFKTKDGGIAGRWCTDHSNCYYKQFKRLEQENKELKECTNTAIIEQEKLLSQLNAEREENKDLKKQIESDKGLITVGGKQQYEMTMAYDKCKTALEEINKIAEPRFVNGLNEEADLCNLTMDRIQDKIKEVLND